MDQGPATSAGTIAHRAVQRWIDSGNWRDPGAAPTELSGHYLSAAAEVGVAVDELFEGRLTGSRLRKRAAELSRLLSAFGPGAHVTAEVTLHDASRRLRGVLDLLVDSQSGPAVIDLKTGADATGDELPEHITNQLLIYAHLVGVARGLLPSRLAVFSLRTGVRWIPASPADVDLLLDRISEARCSWMAGVRDARPDPQACRFCPQRLSCDPQWLAAPAWERPDMVEGTVVRSSLAASGTVALLLQAPSATGWLTQLPASHLPAEASSPGSRVRAVRVLPAREREGSPPEWRATELSALWARRRPGEADG